MRFWFRGCHGFVIEVGGLSDEGVHLARIDLSGGGVIDKGDGRAVVVGDPSGDSYL